MSNSTLTAIVREGRGKGPARQTRMAGNVPAVIYGLGGDNISVSVNAHDLEKILHGGVNSLITLDVAGKQELALCRQVHRHPVRPLIMHVDFIRVEANVEVEAEVALNLTGEPEGVRNGGMLDQMLFAVSILAKPGSIPQTIDHDVSGMTLGDQLHVGDLVAPPGVTIALEASELVAQISVPRGLATAEGDAGEGVEAVGGTETASE